MSHFWRKWDEDATMLPDGALGRATPPSEPAVDDERVVTLDGHLPAAPASSPSRSQQLTHRHRNFSALPTCTLHLPRNPRPPPGPGPARVPLSATPMRRYARSASTITTYSSTRRGWVSRQTIQKIHDANCYSLN